jgi:hypothetical protein
LDTVQAGEVPRDDTTTADGGFDAAPIFADAAILLDASVEVLGVDASVEALGVDASVEVLGVDAGAAGPIDTSADKGPELEGGAATSAETGGVDLGAGEVFADNFSCSAQVPPDAGISQRVCNDFSNPASTSNLVPEAGTWTVADGFYTAMGPADQVTCPADSGTVMTASVLAGLSAQNVRVHAKMTSVVGPDKLLVLRSRPGGNRIEVNFRANFVDNGQPQGGDLNLADLVDCVNAGDYISAGGANRILIPHAVGQSIMVDLQLVGQQITIAVDGRIVFDRSLPISTNPGSVGFAVFRNSTVLFDDLLVDVLD